ncbi:unnamed protein product [Onchocerca flexuosa]|uniref:aECM cysteine-cradle domain-containing protein n=1 Tax=Onchocerca flexuosa TaxID=387005 RepID=A0A183HA64_9BILA|nr:unnamed protein product [Onchocerca flexuosa]
MEFFRIICIFGRINERTPPDCSLIRKFISLFKIANPAEWIRLNCSFARLCFTQSSCEQLMVSL